MTLYHGGLAFGSSDTSLAWFDTRNGRSGLRAIADMRVAAPGPVADHQTVSVLLPGFPRPFQPNEPPSLVVVRETFAFAAPPDDDHVMVKYTLFNPAPWTVAGLFAGEVLDQDVGPDAFNNFVQWEPADRSVRQFSVPNSVWTGHVMLGEDPSSHQFWHNGNPPNDDPDTGAEAFGFLSGGILGLDFHGPRDVRDLLSTGPFDLGTGMSRVVAFAFVADESWDAVGNGIAAARARWDALPAATRDPYPVVPVTMAAVPAVIQVDAPGPMQVHLTFPSALAPLFDPATAMCAGARPTHVQRQGPRITAFLERSALDPYLVQDQWLICSGYLVDGSAWIGADRVRMIANTGPLAEPAVVTRLTSDPGNESHPTWSPDGRSIAFDGGRAGLTGVWRMDLAGGEATARLLVPVDAPSAWPDWSPDGTRILFNTPPTVGGIWTVPADGGAPTSVGQGGGMPAWSRDGATIAFARNNTAELWVMDVASGAERIVATEPSNMYPEWGPDGLVYFVARGRTDDTLASIARVDPDIGAGSVERVTPIEGAANYSPTIAPDGRTLVFGSDVPGIGRQVVLQDLRTGLHTVVRFDPGVAPADRLEFSPDGRRLLFSWGGDIYVADLPRWAWRPRP